MDNEKRNRMEDENCQMPSERSISEIVHEHLNNENDHITDEDIRNAKININENELDRTNENRKESQDEKGQSKEKENNKDILTPWDLVDDDAAE